MNEEDLGETLDKLIKQVETMPPEVHIARTLQALNHALYCLNDRRETTGTVA